ncbi:DUF3325 family protein [Variovorax paradoxus]|uniref:DUF3325 family protein n=1 Tax=Variovorax paradoxus TaxID=34073 RepID=UPI001933C651|nr:DUF3325 domain-containing protein [Variovorax paradoxus]
MTQALSILAAFAAALGGFIALSLAMDRHHEDAFGRGRSPGRWRRPLQGAGSALLLLSLAACLAAQGAVIGWVLWFGALTAAALCTVLVASYAAKHAAAIGVAAASLAMPCLALALLR